jgi:hypothetical protein
MTHCTTKTSACWLRQCVINKPILIRVDGDNTTQTCTGTLGGSVDVPLHALLRFINGAGAGQVSSDEQLLLIKVCRKTLLHQKNTP